MSGNVLFITVLQQNVHTPHTNRFRKQLGDVTSTEQQSRGVQNLMKMLDIGFLKTKLTSQFKSWKLHFRSLIFEKWLRLFGDSFSRCLIHNSSSIITGSTVKLFSSCRISVLLVLSYLSWQLVGPIQHGSTSFIVS